MTIKRIINGSPVEIELTKNEECGIYRELKKQVMIDWVRDTIDYYDDDFGTHIFTDEEIDDVLEDLEENLLYNLELENEIKGVIYDLLEDCVEGE